MSAADAADLRADALSAARRAELDRCVPPSAPVSSEEGLRQLWDLLELLTAVSRPLPASREPLKIESVLL